ncbi:MAG: hypothetical protein BWY72_02116 [Bacteroidetes bacterium ADurb.Bin416]|nr:MAG: hypothetical protein BWY72_02116 [Bacteroidetes bacterium ADurb.Bin416]
MLGFQTKTDALLVHDAFFTGNGTVQKVARVYLHAGFVGINFHGTTAEGIKHEANGQAVGSFGAEDPIVVITVAVFQLIKAVLIDAGTNESWLSEIHGRTADGGDFTRGHERRINRSVVIGGDSQYVTHHIVFGITGQVEVGMVGQVNDGWFVGRGFVLDVNGVVIGQGVHGLAGQGSGEAHFTVGRDIRYFKGLLVDLFHIEHAVLKTLGAAM